MVQVHYWRTAQSLGRNGFTSRENYQGVYVLQSSRAHRDVSGSSFVVHFEIVDNRKEKTNPFYRVKISHGKKVMLDKTYSSPGRYSEILECPPQRVSGNSFLCHSPQLASIVVQMTNENQQAYFDSYTVSFNLHFHRLLKVWFHSVNHKFAAVVDCDSIYCHGARAAMDEGDKISVAKFCWLNPI